jgi:hypothetical protein
MPPLPPPPGLSGFQPPVTLPISSPFDSGKPKPSSLVPLFVAIAVVLVGGLLYLFRGELGANVWYLVGYAFTPFAAAMALGLDALLDTKGHRDPWYYRRRYSDFAIRAVVVIGFVTGVLHILELGRWLGEIAVQSGWF